jgi:hypothetical protein
LLLQDGRQVLRNGQGDGWFCGFGLPGAFLKGFDHGPEMSPWSMETSKVLPGVLDNLNQLHTVKHPWKKEGKL